MKKTSTNPRDIERLIGKLSKQKELKETMNENVILSTIDMRDKNDVLRNLTWNDDMEKIFKSKKLRAKQLYSTGFP